MDGDYKGTPRISILDVGLRVLGLGLRVFPNDHNHHSVEECRLLSPACIGNSQCTQHVPGLNATHHTSHRKARRLPRNLHMQECKDPNVQGPLTCNKKRNQLHVRILATTPMGAHSRTVEGIVVLRDAEDPHDFFATEQP